MPHSPPARHPLSAQFRLHYQPRADRLPRWLHRVWAWF